MAESSQVNKFEHVQLGGVPKSQNERGSQVNKFEHVGGRGRSPYGWGGDGASVPCTLTRSDHV